MCTRHLWLCNHERSRGSNVYFCHSVVLGHSLLLVQLFKTGNCTLRCWHGLCPQSPARLLSGSRYIFTHMCPDEGPMIVPACVCVMRSLCCMYKKFTRVHTYIYTVTSLKHHLGSTCCEVQSTAKSIFILYGIASQWTTLMSSPSGSWQTTCQCQSSKTWGGYRDSYVSSAGHHESLQPHNHLRWEKKKTSNSMRWWSENVCWRVSNPCVQQPSHWQVGGDLQIPLAIPKLSAQNSCNKLSARPESTHTR